MEKAKDNKGNTGNKVKLYDVNKYVVQWVLDSYKKHLQPLQRQGKTTYIAQTTKGTDNSLFTVVNGTHKSGKLFCRTWLANNLTVNKSAVDNAYVLYNKNTKTGKNKIGLPYFKSSVDKETILSLRQGVKKALQHIQVNADINVGLDQ